MEIINKLRSSLAFDYISESTFIKKLVEYSYLGRISLDDCSPEERVKVINYLQAVHK